MHVERNPLDESIRTLNGDGWSVTHYGDEGDFIYFGAINTDTKGSVYWQESTHLFWSFKGPEVSCGVRIGCGWDEGDYVRADVKE